jgi:HAE1 family hydrophobic/amphiphilic exporter-1
MIGVTFFGLIFTPSFYVINRMMADWITAHTARLRARFASEAASDEASPVAAAASGGEGA